MRPAGPRFAAAFGLAGTAGRFGAAAFGFVAAAAGALRFVRDCRPCEIRVCGFAGLEEGYPLVVRHSFCLKFERLGGGGVLLDQRRILLRHLVHLIQRLVDLVKAGRLLRAGIGDIRHHRGNLLIDSRISVSDCPAWLARSTPSLT